MKSFIMETDYVPRLNSLDGISEKVSESTPKMQNVGQDVLTVLSGEIWQQIVIDIFC